MHPHEGFLPGGDIFSIYEGYYSISLQLIAANLRLLFVIVQDSCKEKWLHSWKNLIGGICEFLSCLGQNRFI